MYLVHSAHRNKYLLLVSVGTVHQVLQERVLLFHTRLAPSKFTMDGCDINIANNQILYWEKEQDFHFWYLSWA